MRDPLWGQDTSRWKWWQHAVAWAVFIPLVWLIVQAARWITAAVLPF
jgi:hypothetical protein